MEHDELAGTATANPTTSSFVSGEGGGSLRFARPPRPSLRGNQRRHSLVGVLPTPSAADDSAINDTAADGQIGMQRSASYAPRSHTAGDHAEGNGTRRVRSRPQSMYAELGSLGAADDFRAALGLLKRSTMVDEGAVTEEDTLAEEAAPTDIVMPTVQEVSAGEEADSVNQLSLDQEYSIVTEETPSLSAMVADMIAYPDVSPLLPTVAPVPGQSIIVDASLVSQDAVSEEHGTSQPVEEITNEPDSDAESVEMFITSRDMLRPERVRDSVILHGEKSPLLIALHYDGDDDIPALGSGSSSDDDIAALSLPGVLNPAHLVVDEAQPPKSPLLDKVAARKAEAELDDPAEDDLLSTDALLPPAVASAAASQEAGQAVHPSPISVEVNGAASTVCGNVRSVAPSSPTGTAPAVLPTVAVINVESPSSPTIAATGRANGERQILIARLCSLGHTEAAANDALDALPNGDFDQLLLWISRRRLAILKSDAEEEKLLRMHAEAIRSETGIRVSSLSSATLPAGARLSDSASEDSGMILPDVHLVDRRATRDPMHQPPNHRTVSLPRPILKASPGRGGRADGRGDGSRDSKEGGVSSLWQRSRGWFSLPTRLSPSSPTAPRKESPYFPANGTGSLRLKSSPTSNGPSPPSPSPSMESDELPCRQLKQVRFPVNRMAVKYLYTPEPLNKPRLRSLHAAGGQRVAQEDENANMAIGSDADTEFGGDIEALAASTRLSSLDEHGTMEAAAMVRGAYDNETAGTDDRPSQGTPKHASSLHPATKSEAKAAITMDAALAAGTVRENGDEAVPVSTEDVHLHSPRELSVYYRQACRARDERPIDTVLRQLKRAHERGEPMMILTLSGVLLERRAADALADMLALRSGLYRLELDDCSLVNDALKSVLHSLLLVDELRELSLMRNKRLSADGFKYIAIYARKAKHLRVLDISGCRPDKRGCRYLSHALASSSVMMLRSALRTLSMNDCGLRSAFLEVLVPSIRRSNLVELSMTHNRFGPNGAIWIAALLDAEWTPSEETNGLFVGIESRLERLDLSHNDIRSGIDQLSVALRRNRNIQELNLSYNELNPRALSSLAISLTENTTLRCLNLNGNAVSGTSVEGLMQLRASLTFNSSLHTLLLSNTDMHSEGAIALAEFLPETQTLRRLDLSDNSEIDIAGVMALSVSVRMNRSLQYLDVNVMPDDTEMASLSRDILLTCIRNTQLQEETGRAPLNGTGVHGQHVPPPRSSSKSSVDMRVSVS